MIPSIQLDYLSFVVPDLNACVDFCTNYLGFDLLAMDGPIQSPDGDDYTTRVYAVPERAIGRYAQMQSGSIKVEFVEWHIHGQPINPLRESTISGCHLALTVADLEGAIAKLDEIPRMRFMEVDAGGFVYCFTPFGFQIKLIRGEALA